MAAIQRRDFLRRLAQCAPVAAGASAVAVAAAKAQSSVDPALASLRAGVEALQGRVKSIDQRIDALEARQKKLLRIALGAAALSLGIDVSALL